MTIKQNLGKTYGEEKPHWRSHSPDDHLLAAAKALQDLLQNMDGNSAHNPMDITTLAHHLENVDYNYWGFVPECEQGKRHVNMWAWRLGVLIGFMRGRVDNSTVLRTLVQSDGRVRWEQMGVTQYRGQANVW